MFLFKIANLGAVKWKQNLNEQKTKKQFIAPMSLGHVALLMSSQPQAKIKVETER